MSGTVCTVLFCFYLTLAHISIKEMQSRNWLEGRLDE